MDGYVLTAQLSPREFAELIDMDIEVANLLYSAYAVDDSNYGALLGGINEYKVPLIDMFLFIYDQKERGNITLEDDLEDADGRLLPDQHRKEPAAGGAVQPLRAGAVRALRGGGDLCRPGADSGGGGEIL